jgi:UDP-glucose 4-epimerase
MRVLITGGNGFIGSHLVDHALLAGWDVCVYDVAREKYRDQRDNVEYLYGDLYINGLPQEALRDVDVVFHLACTTIHKTSNDDPVFDIQSNLVSTVKLLQQCVRARVNRFVFLSSGGTVYGIPQALPVSESHPTDPICSYGIHKLAIEKYLGLFHHLHGLDYVVLRPSNPYGERQDFRGEQGAVAVFLGKIALGKPISIWGDGEIVRDYFHVDDLARACMGAATQRVKRRVLNISSGVGFSLNALVDKIEAVLGVKAEVHRNSTSARPFDVSELYLDRSEAEKVLSWRPQVTLEQGITRTWLWVQSIVADRD